MFLLASGHTQGGLGRRVRQRIVTTLDEPLTVGAVNFVRATPGLLLLIDGVSEADDDAGERCDLQLLAAQRQLRIVATGRDLPWVMVMSGARPVYRSTIWSDLECSPDTRMHPFGWLQFRAQAVTSSYDWARTA